MPLSPALTPARELLQNDLLICSHSEEALQSSPFLLNIECGVSWLQGPQGSRKMCPCGSRVSICGGEASVTLQQPIMSPCGIRPAGFCTDLPVPRSRERTSRGAEIHPPIPSNSPPLSPHGTALISWKHNSVFSWILVQSPEPLLKIECAGCVDMSGCRCVLIVGLLLSWAGIYLPPLSPRTFASPASSPPQPCVCHHVCVHVMLPPGSNLELRLTHLSCSMEESRAAANHRTGEQPMREQCSSQSESKLMEGGS